MSYPKRLYINMYVRYQMEIGTGMETKLKAKTSTQVSIDR